MNSQSSMLKSSPMVFERCKCIITAVIYLVGKVVLLEKEAYAFSRNFLALS